MCQNYCEGWFAQRFRRARMGIMIMREITPPMTMMPSVDPTSDWSFGSGVVVAWKKNEASASACVKVARLASDCVKAVRAIAKTDARIMMMMTRVVLFMPGKYITRLLCLLCTCLSFWSIISARFQGEWLPWMTMLIFGRFTCSIKTQMTRMAFMTMADNSLCKLMFTNLVQLGKIVQYFTNKSSFQENAWSENFLNGS